MLKRIVIYVDDNGLFDYGFPDTKDWKHVDSSYLEKNNLEYRIYSFNVNKLDFIEKIAIKYVQECNVYRSNHHENLKLIQDPSIIFDPQAEEEFL